jgi:hypothetical protein
LRFLHIRAPEHIALFEARMPAPAPGPARADFPAVPVIEVDRFNIAHHKEGLVKAIQQVNSATVPRSALYILHSL